METYENQQTEDTRKLLRECNAGIKMGVTSIDEVIDMVKDPHLKQVLKDSRAEHNQLGDEIRMRYQGTSPDCQRNVVAQNQRETANGSR